MASTTNKEKPVICQFRYYGLNNDKNNPEEQEEWGPGGNLLTAGPATKIGIQALPGTIFHLGTTNFSSGIIIDHTGVYELDLVNTTTTISNLYFNTESLAKIEAIDNACIIVDVLYIPAEGTV